MRWRKAPTVGDRNFMAESEWFPAVYNIMVMFRLSVAQAASTLAAITVAYNIKLVDQLTVNGMIAVILVTCVGSPWITAKWR